MERTVVAVINQVLDDARRQRELRTDRQLAGVLGVSAKTLSYWRGGKHLPKSTVVLVALMARAYGSRCKR